MWESLTQCLRNDRAEWEGKLAAVRENLKQRGITCAEIARDLGVSRERIRQQMSWDPRKVTRKRLLPEPTLGVIHRLLAATSAEWAALAESRDGLTYIERLGQCVRCRCCECGAEVKVRLHSWVSGRAYCKQCKAWIAEDLTGRQFGKWTVLGFLKSNIPGGVWACRCECGRQRPVRTHNLKRGTSASCGRCGGFRGGPVRKHPEKTVLVRLYKNALVDRLGRDA